MTTTPLDPTLMVLALGLFVTLISGTYVLAGVLGKRTKNRTLRLSIIAPLFLISFLPLSYAMQSWSPVIAACFSGACVFMYLRR